MTSDPSSASSARNLKLGTRGSPLALAQARAVAKDLASASGGALTCEIVTFTTKGDQLNTERLINSGGKGLFTKELDAALLDGRIDLAVHSLKDVPTLLPDGIVCAAFPQRADPREAFICHTAAHPSDLQEGAVVGTASLRREAQTLALRPDLKVIPFRGSVGTRLEKLKAGQADATWLAMAGLRRLGLADEAHPIPIRDMLPAAGQGILAITVREDMDDAAISAVSALNHGPSEAAAIAERALLAELDGSCRTAIAAHLFVDAHQYCLVAEVLSPGGAQRWRREAVAPGDSSHEHLVELGHSLGREIREAAGGALPSFEDP